MKSTNILDNLLPYFLLIVLFIAILIIASIIYIIPYFRDKAKIFLNNKYE